MAPSEDDRAAAAAAAAAFDSFVSEMRAELSEIVWASTPSSGLWSADDVADEIIAAGWMVDAPPGILTSPQPAVWVHCSPALLQTVADCAATPRRPCVCPGLGSHDHLVDQSWLAGHPEITRIAGG